MSDYYANMNLAVREWHYNQKKPSSNFRKLLQDHIDKATPCRTLTTEEVRRLANLKSVSMKMKRGEYVQNRQLQTCLSYDKPRRLKYLRRWVEILHE